ncbi:MAG: hypothetical protein RL150_214 [Candidatus Parcubacteria bacterium]|jgi:uncharacterized protein YqeY
MALVDTIKEQMKQAMRDKDQVRLTVLRGLLSAFTNELVATGKTPQDAVSDELAMTVIKRSAKQRKDAIEQFVAGGREDLAEGERAELLVLDAFLPQLMSRDEIKAIATAKKEALGVTDKAGMGKLMGALMAELKDRADGGDVKAVVDELFA